MQGFYLPRLFSPNQWQGVTRTGEGEAAVWLDDDVNHGDKHILPNIWVELAIHRGQGGGGGGSSLSAETQDATAHGSDDGGGGAFA